MSNEIKNCIIVGAGDFSSLVTKPDDKTLIIAADGGMNHLKRAGIVPHIWIGDGDSIEGEVPDGCEIIKLNRDKDETDMLAAIRLAVEMGCMSFHLYGCLGGRIDHTVANIKILNMLANNGIKAYMYDKMSMLTVIKNESITFPKEAEGNISIFAMSERAIGVTIEGLKWELLDETLFCTDTIGVSNEFTGAKSSISVKEGNLLVVVGG